MDNVDPLRGSAAKPGHSWGSNRAAEFWRLVRNAAEFEPDLDRAYVVKWWLNQAAMSVVYGESNVGKSFFRWTWLATLPAVTGGRAAAFETARRST